MLYVLRSRPSSELSRRWYARSRCRGQGQEVRAGEPVRAHESRCSGAPLLTCKRIMPERRRESSRRPQRYSWSGSCIPITRENKVCHHGCQPAVGCSEGVARALRACRGSALRGCRGQSSATQIYSVAGTDPYASAVPERAAPKVGVNRAGDYLKQANHKGTNSFR